MTDISNFSDISEDQGLSERSSQFSHSTWKTQTKHLGGLVMRAVASIWSGHTWTSLWLTKNGLKPIIKNEGKKEKGLNVLADALMEQSR